MNILVEIGHPAHVHFFKNPITLWRERGHRVVVVTRDKEITNRLLDEYGIAYRSLSRQRTNLFAMALELIWRWLRILFIIKKERIDVAVSIAGISTALPAWLSRIPGITLTDTEDATLSNRIAFPFSSVVLTPSAFRPVRSAGNLKSYDSFHELSYLHPDRFKPDSDVLAKFNLKPGDRYVVVRLVRWRALHDEASSGITRDELRELINFLEESGYRVVISSERELSVEYQGYLIKSNFSAIFDLLAHSVGYIGESPTMAMEAALLGRPSVAISSRLSGLGYISEMEERYGLIASYPDFNAARAEIYQNFFSDAGSEERKANLEKLLKEKCDVAAWLAEYVVEYCEK